MNKFPYKLSAINKTLESEGLPLIKKQRIAGLIKSGHIKPDIHYTTEKGAKNTFYFYSDEAMRFFRDWSIKRMLNEKK